MTTPSTGPLHGEYLRLEAALSSLRDAIYRHDDELSELEAELADYKQSPGVRAEYYRKKAAKAEAERDEAIQAQKNQAAHLEHIAAGSIPAKNLRVGNFATPRVITADELRVGQRVAVISSAGVYQGGGKFVSLSSRMAGGLWFEVMTGRKGSDAWRHSDTDTIVLLADAPDEQQEPNAAPVTAETIRQSEPGSTWNDKHGAAWEWTGGGLAYHSQFGDLGKESLTDYVVQQSGPFTRSTAAPRGNYGKPELPTEPGSVVLVTKLADDYPNDDAREALPFYANAYEFDGHFTWDSIDGRFNVTPKYITGWKPAYITGWKPAYITTSDPVTAHERTDQK